MSLANPAGQVMPSLSTQMAGVIASLAVITEKVTQTHHNPPDLTTA
jgi:hypothetical protein